MIKTTILQMLKKKNGYISGQELCEYLGVSRTAVWKAIQRLKEEGYEIKAVPNKGYCLRSQPNIVTESEIKSYLSTAWAGKTIEYYEKISSTNTQAKQLAEHGAEHGTLVVAQVQEEGRGRRGRGWISPEGASISMSLLLRPKCSPSCASMLTLVAALGMAQAILEVSQIECQIKWPNDIVINGKKVCGILTEMSTETEMIHYVVIGTGVNVNIEEFPQELLEKATSLKIESGKEIKRAELIASFLKYFENAYECFMKTENLELLLEDYNRILVNRNRTVLVLDPKQEYRATARGVTVNGGLLIEKEDGKMEEITSGEVSVRGIYGYV